MANILDRTADVVNAINAGTYSAPFDAGVTAVRVYAPVHKLEDLVDLTISVAPGKYTLDLTDRQADSDEDDVINVGVQKRVASLANSDIDPLAILCRQIADVLMNLDDAVEVTVAPVYDHDHLNEAKVFTSILTVTFRSVQ